MESPLNIEGVQVIPQGLKTNVVKQGRFRLTLEIAELLLHDTEDLIHKAVGWMLREVGKRDEL